MNATHVIESALPYILMILSLLMAVIAGGHAIIYRRDVRTSIAWVGFILLAPLLGSLLYFTLGVNRVRRRAQAIRPTHEDHLSSSGRHHRCSAEGMTYLTGAAHLEAMVRMMDRVVEQPLVSGNRVELLVGGDAAYASMLEAIDQAARSVTLTSYIFDSDRAGGRFVEALARAVGRHVAVRVLVDGVGERYSRPPISRLLRRAGVPAARFLKPQIPWRFTYMNLRSHRKIMVADGRIGFTGGMNIREGHLQQITPPPARPFRDVHARLEGPIVAQMQHAFIDDWLFSTGEHLSGEAWLPDLEPTGDVVARGIPDGPDEYFDVLRMTLLGVLSVARQRVRVATPYFLPDPALITALNVAAMRGVQVDIVIPARSNLRLVQWASMALLWQVLERGCRVWLTPPPFDHTKLMVVDGVWTLLGSGNWDARSLRLNFEFDVECYDRALARRAEQIVEERIAAAEDLTLEAVDQRPLLVRLRDSLARLASPYL